jgi:hypothetical protein
MKTKTYKVIGKEGANIRALQSATSKLEGHLNTGDKAEIVADFYSQNGETKYLCIHYNEHFYWVAAANLMEVVTPKPATVKKPIDYREKTASSAAKIYPLCVGRKHGSGVQKKVKNLDEFKKQKELNCHLMVSLVLQEAGLLPKGCVITHTPKGGNKRKIADAVKGIEKLRHCKVYWVNKRYKNLPEKWRKAGIVYIQDSNACMSAGGGKIWSCNKSVGEKYKSKGDYLRTAGYPFNSKILCAIVPCTE